MQFYSLLTNSVQTLSLTDLVQMNSYLIFLRITINKFEHNCIYLLIFLQLCGSIETKKPQKFFVESAKCKMPFVRTFSADVRSIWNPPDFEGCTNDSDDFDMVTSHYDSKKKHYILKINETFIKHYKKKLNIRKVECGYHEIVRAGSGKLADKKATLLPIVYFKNNYIVPKDIHGLIVQCYPTKYAVSPMYKGAFAFVQDREIQFKENPNYQPNVIMIGLDSLSRINFRRNMPLTSRYINKRKWFELQGYNKVDDNTLPNLLAVLTGYTTNQADSTYCNTSAVGCFEKLPFIWGDYKRAGYLTAYAEDLAQVNTFTYFKPGFVHEPVDYYLRPFMFAAEQTLKTKMVYNFEYCIEQRLSISYIWDFCQEFVSRFLDRNPIFGLFWSSSFTHDFYDTASTLDTRMLQFLKNLEKIGLFKDSIVIFFSDHGMRWGELRGTKEGFLEERLPLLYVSLPNWFSERYPAYDAALKTNRNRLSSNYDLHMTLQHILQLNDKTMSGIKPPIHCPGCQSLFFLLPENRSCADAGIAEHWCTCDPYETVSDTIPFTQKLPNEIIQRMNDYIHIRGLSHMCSNLTLKTAKTVDRKLDLNTSSMVKGNSSSSTYRVHFITNPNAADFEATVHYDINTNELDLHVETISRLNSYRWDAKCLEDKIGKKYCICYDSIQIESK